LFPCLSSVVCRPVATRYALAAVSGRFYSRNGRRPDQSVGGAGPIRSRAGVGSMGPGTLTFSGRYSAPGRAGETALAVVIPFESLAPASVDRLVDLVTTDMDRVNAAILARTGSQVTMIPEVANHLINSGGKRLRPILTVAM